MKWQEGMIFRMPLVFVILLSNGKGAVRDRIQGNSQSDNKAGSLSFWRGVRTIDTIRASM